MLTTLINPLPRSNPSAEDHFSSALTMISPEDISVLHGDPGSSLTYSSKRFGDLELQLAEPQSEDDRKLFAQYLWNAGVLMAEFVGGVEDERGRKKLDVKGETVLELGAGTGLAGIVSVLAEAHQVVISDYPAPELLATIEFNIKRNIPASLVEKVAVQGHEWGTVTDDFSKAHAHRFNRILSADCLWISGQHHSLAESMLHFLSFDADAQVWVVAGFHTGRANVASFLESVEDVGLEVGNAWERDVDGNEREWMKEQSRTKTDDVVERKRWLLIAILRRKSRSPITS